MKELSEVHKAYIAGIIDGEGSIMLNRINKGKAHAPVVSVASTDKELLDWLREITGAGSMALKPSRKDTHKDSYDWKIAYNVALDLLGAIFPYLKIERKRYRANLLLTEYKGLTPRNGKYSADLLSRKEDFIYRFHNPSPL